MSSGREDDGGDQLGARVPVRFAQADCEVTLADVVGAIRSCQIGSLESGIGNLQLVQLARMLKMALYAPLVVAEGFAGGAHHEPKPVDVE